MSGDVFKDAFRRHAETVAQSEKILTDVRRAAELMEKTVKNGGKILTCGNGGSAADAQHLAAEFVCRYKKERGPLPAIALTTDTSALTAIGNDYGFEKVFARQVEALVAQGDVLVAITTSGKSPNVLQAIQAAKKKGAKVVALTGANGAGLKESSDVAVIVPTEETARIQEVHELVIHAWCEYMDTLTE